MEYLLDRQEQNFTIIIFAQCCMLSIHEISFKKKFFLSISKSWKLFSMVFASQLSLRNRSNWKSFSQQVFDLQVVTFTKQGFFLSSYSEGIGIASNKKYYPDSFFRTAWPDIILWWILFPKYIFYSQKEMRYGISFGSARTEICPWLFLLNVVCFLSMKFLSKRSFFFQFLRAENNSLWFLLLN